MLSQDQVRFYGDNGYVRVPGLFADEEVESLRRELDELIQTWATTTKGWTGPWRLVYMSPDVEQRSMLTALHDLHFYSAAWCRAVTNPRLAEVMAELIGPNVELHHTTLHVKPPETGMPFPLHQDSPFYQHEGPAYVDAIIHLDDTNDENGCLRFVAGSHKRGHLDHITLEEGNPVSPHLPTATWPLADTVACPAKAGDVVAFSIYTVHGSNINRTDRWRRLVRVGYRDPMDRQLSGQSFGRAGLIVRGLRPAGALAPTMS
jgi:ectoine hydroxylase-related dioxygenase (phytanoyl-CoA dioxygenase family)